jgi:transcriptional regulator with XRE-family HTH domain
MQAMQTQPCHQCDGTGKELDHKAVGLELRNKRVVRKKTIKEIAKVTGLSTAYISDLETGRRNWNALLIESYKQALKS